MLQLLATGASNRAIAEQLVITERTVKAHLTSIFDKLRVTSRTQAAARARNLGRVSIAQKLVISEHTVKVHVTNILAKLRVASRTQAAARASELHLR